MKGKVISYITRRNLFKLGANAVGTSVIADLINSKKLKIVGGFYDLDTGLMTQVV